MQNEKHEHCDAACMNIRKLDNLKDMQKVIDLIYAELSKYNKTTASPIAFQRYKLSNNKTFVGHYNGEVVATATVVPIYRVNGSLACQIEDVVTHPDYRGCGLGKRIIEHCIGYAKLIGAYKIMLSCADHNIAFYERCGFEPKETQMRYKL